MTDYKPLDLTAQEFKNTKTLSKQSIDLLRKKFKGKYFAPYYETIDGKKMHCLSDVVYRIHDVVWSRKHNRICFSIDVVDRYEGFKMDRRGVIDCLDRLVEIPKKDLPFDTTRPPKKLE